ncbi:NAD(P) transhydrogenase subunit beta [Nocardiopsis mwathae]|uniref:NAD(P) transhydrogenase subunit beta n=1 Tax=Nocardiopsis mwathae TaxID=1472723 RepID=A0A7W9YF59_9ACTN|nr:NAD(P)(+) transhydrogenase (Re/Si-specific) subunit beta [Nocardiopsis mwathae]MBB6170977.1 NAD(P) transhydrogenase subunit beta [Nocardiopsis mwathae]
MSAVDVVVRLVYLAAATLFVIGLHLMNSPATARRGNVLSAVGMGAAVAVTLVLLLAAQTVTPAGWAVIAVGTLVGSAAGLYAARRVAMTAMPQLVSLFNAVGGGAAALIGIHDYLRFGGPDGDLTLLTTTAVTLDVIIGTVAFSGSLVASAKLQGWMPGRPLLLPLRGAVNLVVAAVIAVASVGLIAELAGTPALLLIVVAALLLGVLVVLAIGGADMPVVVSLLNSCTGVAVAMAGFVIGNSMLIIAGALVGASGGILTKLMADAMNRPIRAILVGGYGTGDAAGALPGGAGDGVRTIDADDAAIRLAYAGRVIIVPGYGLAAAQAQHELHELAELLEERGVRVDYAIHPVAGRMPGHMNVLLAEAKVPYSQMREMDEINPEFPRAAVALVVGANDVTNPAARRPGTPVSGMPILDVDRAETVIVVKRSLGHGYAGIDNELYTDPRTRMYLADAKTALSELGTAVKTLVG